jgi:hypothetical protein
VVKEVVKEEVKEEVPEDSPTIKAIKEKILERYNLDPAKDANFKKVVDTKGFVNYLHQGEKGAVAHCHCIIEVEGITVDEFAYAVGNIEFRKKWDENLQNKLTKFVKWDEKELEAIVLMYPKMPPVPFISGRELLQRFNTLKDFPEKG